MTTVKVRSTGTKAVFDYFGKRLVRTVYEGPSTHCDGNEYYVSLGILSPSNPRALVTLGQFSCFDGMCYKKTFKA